MFEQDLFGGAPNLEAAQFEAQVPALPSPGQRPLPGDGDGNYTIPLGAVGGGGMVPAGPPPPAGAAIIPLGRTGQLSGMPGMDGATWEQMEPGDTSGSAAVRSAGFTALLATAGIGIGVAAGGAWGAAAGLLFAGALTNGYRAQKWWDSANPSEKHEAVVSSVFSAASLGVGAYLTYKAVQTKREEEE